MLERYPPHGFHFRVTFQLFPQSPHDMGFQEVSGLSWTIETEKYNEGGENRFSHQLPVRNQYEDLVLKRGLLRDSAIMMWCTDAIRDFVFQPINIIVSLLDHNHLPLYTWVVVNAIPKKWSVSSFNAEENSLAIENLTLGYQYFRGLSLLNVPRSATEIIQSI